MFGRAVGLEKYLPFDRLALNIGVVLLSISALLASLSPVLNNLYDVTPIGRHIHQLQSQGYTVSYVGKYHNTFGFSGKLNEPLNVISNSMPELHAFLKDQPGYTIWIQRKKTEQLAEQALYMTPFRGKWLFIMDNKAPDKVLQEQTSLSDLAIQLNG